MKKTINVTANDIKNGRKNQKDNSKLVSESCPIALACSRIFRDCEVTIGYDLYLDGYRKHKLPHRATEFINRFDNHKQVRPFKFQIEI